MNWWRTVTVAFWTFVVLMLIWQSYTYNNQVEISKTHPGKHYFYNSDSAFPTPPKTSAPDVRQVAYKVIRDSPQPGNFTVQFTVKNLGSVAATAIQVKVRPYLGFIQGDQDNGHVHGGTPISDNDPASQIGQWVALPDLAPGQSSSNSAVFIDQPNLSPNEDNPKLDMIFEPVKAK